VTLDDVARLPDSEWPHTPASAVMQTDWPTGQLTWTLAQAVAAMEGYDVDRIPILDRETFVGMITTGEILKLDAILETTEEGHTPPTRSKRSP
jgi:CBS domain-containing protein